MTLVAGPPCGGKSTFVAGQASFGDMLVDFDLLAGCLGMTRGHGYPDGVREFAGVAKDAVLARFVAGEHGVSRLWIIKCAPGREERAGFRERFNADVVVVTASRKVCQDRAVEGRPSAWLDGIDQWFDGYEPDVRDRVVMTDAKGATS